MNFISLQTLQAHQALVWTVFLLPVFLVMWRGYILDSRAHRYDRVQSYSPLLALGFVPVVNIAVAVACTSRTVVEYRRRQYDSRVSW